MLNKISNKLVEKSIKVNESDFIERKYSAEGLEEFISFAIKIRLQGTNSCEVPYLKDLRAIALAT